VTSEYTVLSAIEGYDPLVLWAVLRSPAIRADMLLVATGANRTRISWSGIQNLKIPYPSEVEASKFSKKIRQALVEEVRIKKKQSSMIESLSSDLSLFSDKADNVLDAFKPPQIKSLFFVKPSHLCKTCFIRHPLCAVIVTASTQKEDAMPESALVQKPYTPTPRVPLPGAFAGNVTLSMHTYEARSLIYGTTRRGRPTRSVGLFLFSREIRTLWDQSKEGDPFADWHLNQVRKALTDAIDTLREMQSGLEAMIQTDDLDFGIAESRAIVVVTLNFGNPYGYIGARLVIASDKLVRLVYSCKHTGILTEVGATGMVRNAVRTTQRALISHRKYKNRAVTREDAVQNNKRWQEAVALMGEPPEDIIKGRRADIAPRPAINVVPDKEDANKKEIGDEADAAKEKASDEDTTPEGIGGSEEEPSDDSKDSASTEPAKKPARKRKSSV